MRKTYLVAAALIGVLVVTGSVQAMKNANAADRVGSSTEDRIAKICSVVNARLDERITRFDANHERHVTAYRNLETRVTKFVERIEAKGYDATKIKADLIELNTKIEKLATDYRAYIAVLRGSREVTCGGSEGVFRGKLTEAKRLLGIVHQDVLDIRNYYQTTIRPDIRAIKDQVPDLARVKKNDAATTTATSTDETEE